MAMPGRAPTTLPAVVAGPVNNRFDGFQQRPDADQVDKTALLQRWLGSGLVTRCFLGRQINLFFDAMNFTLEDTIHHVKEIDNWKAPKELQRKFPYYLSGYDQKDQPIWMAEVGKYNVREQIEKGPEAARNLTLYMFQGVHRIYRSLYAKDQAGKEVRTGFFVGDCEGLDLNQATHLPTVTYALETLRKYNDFLPLLVGHVVAFNVNYIATLAFESLRPLLGGVFDKIELYGPDKARYQAALKKWIPAETIPTWYGGNKEYKPIQVFGIVHSEDARTIQSLRSVQVIIRHGDREADDSIENPKGKLTNKGKKQMYDVGQFLRERYENFLEKTHLTSTTSVLSSDNDRTIVSAHLVALGLSNGEVNGLDWLENTRQDMPIPVRTVPKEFDHILRINRRDCPKFEKLIQDSLIPFVTEFTEKNIEYFIKYVNHTGDLDVFNKSLLPDSLNTFTFYQEQAIYNKSIGLPLDEIAMDALLNPNLIYKPGFQAKYFDTLEKQRVYIGPFLRLFVDAFLVEDGKKLRIYSGHDKNLNALMNTLEIWQEPNLVPPVGATLISELHETSSGGKYLERVSGNPF
ncbi:unnamed protein product [Allacma fusca]|uniref:2-phosphoxylose phosphatase 1 n=1 Tax=Allacma fusca TaxID=39272 RepID=A0A8J2NY31_9HEXA|nr:unnamed protein product [Allacma fusca]